MGITIGSIIWLPTVCIFAVAFLLRVSGGCCHIMVLFEQRRTPGLILHDTPLEEVTGNKVTNT